MTTVQDFEKNEEFKSEDLSSTSVELKEWIKGKGGLPICNLIFSHLREKAMKENEEEVLDLIDQVPHCNDLIFTPESKSYEDFETDLEIKLTNILKCIDENGGYCDESDLLQLEILEKPFLPKLEEAGVKSLGEKSVNELKLMLSNLAFFNFFLRYMFLFVQSKVDGQTQEKLEFLAEKLSEFMIKISPESKVLIKALRYVLCVEHKHALSCKLLECGSNWESFIFDFVKEPNMPFIMSILDIF